MQDQGKVVALLLALYLFKVHRQQPTRSYAVSELSHTEHQVWNKKRFLTNFSMRSDPFHLNCFEKCIEKTEDNNCVMFGCAPGLLHPDRLISYFRLLLLSKFVFLQKLRPLETMTPCSVDLSLCRNPCRNLNVKFSQM